MSSQIAAAWLPALFGVLVICCESTRVMGADHTTLWLSRLCSPLMQIATAKLVELNHVLRKCGHFFGYGTLGLVFLRGWLSLLLTRHRTWTKARWFAGGLAVLSVLLIASMDELHQSMLPNRTACVADVLLDTAGALFLISVASLVTVLRRRRMLMRLLELRSNRHWQAGSWLATDVLFEQSR